MMIKKKTVDIGHIILLLKSANQSLKKKKKERSHWKLML